MILPPETKVFQESLDPRDLNSFGVSLKGVAVASDDPLYITTGILDAAEEVADITIVPLAEATAKGLRVATDDYTLFQPTPTTAVFFLQIADAEQDNERFTGEGELLGVLLTVMTNSTPPRIVNRTLGVQVRQK
jgi:hypothetical protein